MMTTQNQHRDKLTAAVRRRTNKRRMTVVEDLLDVGAGISANEMYALNPQSDDEPCISSSTLLASHAHANRAVLTVQYRMNQRQRH